jgi:hypothetical protein
MVMVKVLAPEPLSQLTVHTCHEDYVTSQVVAATRVDQGFNYVNDNTPALYLSDKCLPWPGS